MADKMSINEYLMILRKMLVKSRSVVRESKRYYKVYLPMDYNEIWRKIHEEKRKVDVIVFLPDPVNYVDKILLTSKNIVRENDRYKIYLNKKYNKLWEMLHKQNKKVDLLVVLKH